MFEQAELRGIPMGPHGPPNAKGTAYIAPGIAILETRPFWWSFWSFWAKQAILAILAAHFRGTMDLPEKKVPLRIRL